MAPTRLSVQIGVMNSLYCAPHHRTETHPSPSVWGLWLVCGLKDHGYLCVTKECNAKMTCGWDTNKKAAALQRYATITALTERGPLDLAYTAVEFTPAEVLWEMLPALCADRLLCTCNSPGFLWGCGGAAGRLPQCATDVTPLTSNCRRSPQTAAGQPTAKGPSSVIRHANAAGSTASPGVGSVLRSVCERCEQPLVDRLVVCPRQVCVSE